MKDKELRDELEGLPFLRKMKEQPPHDVGLQVPKNYFKHLPDEVLRKAKEPVPVSQPNWLERLGGLMANWLQPRYAVAFASMLALVVAGVFFLGKNDGATEQPVAVISLADISDEELFAYVSDNVGEFDHQLVLEATGPNLPEFKTSSNPKLTLPKTAVPKPAVEEVEEYLDEVIDEIEVEDLEELL